MHLQKIIISILILFFGINTFAEETLIFAADVVRHGDRTPQLVIPKAPHQWDDFKKWSLATGMKLTAIIN